MTKPPTWATTKYQSRDAILQEAKSLGVADWERTVGLTVRLPAKRNKVASMRAALRHFLRTLDWRTYRKKRQLGYAVAVFPVLEIASSGILKFHLTLSCPFHVPRDAFESYIIDSWRSAESCEFNDGWEEVAKSNLGPCRIDWEQYKGLPYLPELPRNIRLEPDPLFRPLSKRDDLSPFFCDPPIVKARR